MHEQMKTAVETATATAGAARTSDRETAQRTSGNLVKDNEAKQRAIVDVAIDYTIHLMKVDNVNSKYHSVASNERHTMDAIVGDQIGQQHLSSTHAAVSVLKSLLSLIGFRCAAGSRAVLAAFAGALVNLNYGIAALDGCGDKWLLELLAHHGINGADW